MIATIKKYPQWVFGGLLYLAAVDYIAWTSHDLAYRASAIVIEAAALSALVGYGLSKLDWLDRPLPLPKPLKWVLAVIGIGALITILLALVGTALLAQSALSN